MKKRIDLIAPPFKGHLIPLLGIARELADDYHLRVICSPSAMADIAAAGLIGVPVMAKNQPILFSIANPPHSVGNNPFRLNGQFKEAIRVMVELGAELRALWNVVPPDLVIADFVVPVAGAVAQKLGIPWWTSMVSPCVIETQDGPPGYMGGWPLSDSLFWRTRYVMGRATVQLFKQALFAIYRPLIQQVGVERLYREDGSEAIYSSNRILALGMPELEFCRRWPQAVHFVGPMLYSPPTKHLPPVFEVGKRHVLVTLGTHLAWHKEEFAKLIEETSLLFSDVVFHFSDGVADRDYFTEKGNFKRFAFIHYPCSINNYDLVIHHGGTGIMYHTLAAGKPSIVYPLDYDQFDYMARLVHHGLALRLKTRSVKDLARAVKMGLDDKGMKSRCEVFRDRCLDFTSQSKIKKLVNEHFLNQEALCESS